jgi:hypothetical protein
MLTDLFLGSWIHKLAPSTHGTGSNKNNNLSFLNIPLAHFSGTFQELFKK